jgi:DMSO/TMAO reductase YedYZ heme-binding membrane subunit
MKPFGLARGVLAGCQPGTRPQDTRVPVRARFLPAAGTARPPGRPSSGLPRSNWPRSNWHGALIIVLLASRAGPGTVPGTSGAGAILASLQRFFLAYSGVFALLALTAAVAAGLIATDRHVISPAGRVTFQAVHRALSLAAVGFLTTHVLLEILAHRSRAIDAVVPFLASGRTLYLGLGTLAADLIVLIALTGVARGRFAAQWGATWRGVHITAYLGWPLAVLHGLLSGRTAKPYVDWSYGGCVAAVALALMIRLVAAPRSRTGTAAYPVPGRVMPEFPPVLLTAPPPSGRLPVKPPPAQRALPGETRDGGRPYGHDGGMPYGFVYGIVDDASPRPPEMP